tara:strand:- start:113 stop:322 length:210 start_codon:yes stop_codon:yes gene_type:complete
MDSIYQQEKELTKTALDNVALLVAGDIPAADSCVVGKEHPNILMRCTAGKAFDNYSNVTTKPDNAKSSS